MKQIKKKEPVTSGPELNIPDNMEEQIPKGNPKHGVTEEKAKPQPKQETGVTVTPKPDGQFLKVDLNSTNLPDLDDFEVVPIDLSSNYWTPQIPGESKRCYFDSIADIEVQDINDKEIIVEIPCAFFYGSAGKVVSRFANGSKRLVAVLKNNHIERGTPLEITFLGKVKNSTNSFKSDSWSVKPLMLKIGK